MAGSKILELSDELSVSGRHLNTYFANRNWDAECVALPDRDVNELTKWLPYVQENALALRFSPEMSDAVLAQFPRLPTDVNWLGTADTLLLEKQEWWPRLLTYETLRTVLVHRFPDLDTGECAYIVGATRKGRAIAASLAAVGFSRIRFIDSERERMESEMQILRRYLFSVEISGVDPETLTMESIPGSLMLNTLPMQDHGTALADLSYFNFMRSSGIVIDIAECTQRNAFLTEAESANLRTFSGLQYQSQLDVNLLQKIFPEQYVTYEDYLESFLEQNPPSV